MTDAPLMPIRPQRVQRKRSRGWCMPPNTVCVTRPGPFGNPFVVSTRFKPGAHIGGFQCIAVPTAEDAVECFKLYVPQVHGLIERAKRELRGKHLACFCALDEPWCHADISLRIVNEPEGGTSGASDA